MHVVWCGPEGGRDEIAGSVWASLPVNNRRDSLSGKQGLRHTMVCACMHIYVNIHSIDTQHTKDFKLGILSEI